jgi:ACS family hexuronate transporter-like MFS transporter
VGASVPLKQQLASPSRVIRNFRWYICGLLLYATTVNYMDRMVLSILEPVISRDLKWSNTDYGTINSIFQAGYAIMIPLAGRVMDWLGLRVGYSLAASVWSLSSMAHALARTAGQFSLARLGLGLGEAANFPACIKAVADWFPTRERALATGIFNSGSNLGPVLGPLFVPLVADAFGWHAAFIFTGSLSASWVIVWLLLYREPEEHPRLSREELAFIRSDNEPPVTATIPYRDLLTKKAAWAFIIGKFMTDPVWWFYLTWLPGFLSRKYNLNVQHLGAPLIVVYAVAAIGSVGGGWLSSSLLRRGWEVGRARKTAMLICAVCVTAVVFVPSAAGNLWLAVALMAIAAAAHQGWSANLFTIASDNFPRTAVGSVVGLGGFGGALGGSIVQISVGKWLDFSHGAYGPIFLIAGSMYLLALLIMQFLLPRYRKIPSTV